MPIPFIISRRRVRHLFISIILAALLLFSFRNRPFKNTTKSFPLPTRTSSKQIKGLIDWKSIPIRHLPTSPRPLPTQFPSSPIPRIQHDFAEAETESAKHTRLERKAAVKKAFLHSWTGYKNHAWMQDEVSPLSGRFSNKWGGRGITLVDSLDTLLIMRLDEEFEEALRVVEMIDFSTSAAKRVNVFETGIRYLGGLLGAYDLSCDKRGKKESVLLEKAVQLGDMLLAAFDTKSRFPMTMFDWEMGALNQEQEPFSRVQIAEVGSLTLEFTRLSQLTGDSKYYDAVQHITDVFERHQNKTFIPGLFPTFIYPVNERFDVAGTFTFGAGSDSLYEYFPKMHMLLGGATEQYKGLYERAVDAAKRHLFFRPMAPNSEDILVSGTIVADSLGASRLVPEAQHLACFVGGMVAIGAKIFDRPEDLDIARKLVTGCIWAYDSMPTGIMPETFTVDACRDGEDCELTEMDAEEGTERLPAGFKSIDDKRYLLRPEAIESLFILYRITGDTILQDAAWRMFTAIQTATVTPISHAVIVDVTCPPRDETKKVDSCPSFWMAETLKYFYLIFEEPGVVSLDECVLNTEAHPLRRPQWEE